MISINSAWALPAEAARAVAPGRTIVPKSEAFSFFGSMVSRGFGGIKTPKARAVAGATGTTTSGFEIAVRDQAALRRTVIRRRLWIRRSSAASQSTP